MDVVLAAWNVCDNGVDFRVVIRRPVHCGFTLRFGRELVGSLKQIMEAGGFELGTPVWGLDGIEIRRLIVFMSGAGLARVLISALDDHEQVRSPLALNALGVSRDLEYAGQLLGLLKKLGLSTSIVAPNEAQSSFTAHKPDLVFLDLYAACEPDRVGLDLLDAIRGAGGAKRAGCSGWLGGQPPRGGRSR